jgi:GntR family transcriptional regulator
VPIRIDGSDPRPIYLQIADAVRGDIVSGTLRPGERLPSVRDLAAELRINPNTVQHAFRELDQAGLLSTSRGHGTFVADRLPRSAKAEVHREVAAIALRHAEQAGMSTEELLKEIRRLADGPRRSRDVA